MADTGNRRLRPGELVLQPGHWLRVGELVKLLRQIEDQRRYVVLMIRPPEAVADEMRQYTFAFVRGDDAALKPHPVVAPAAVSLLGSCYNDAGDTVYGVDNPLVVTDDAGGTHSCVVLWGDAGGDVALPLTGQTQRDGT